MKRIVFISVIAAMISVSCGNTRANGGDEKKTSAEPVTEAGPPALAIAEPEGAQLQGPSDFSGNGDGTQSSAATDIPAIGGGTPIADASDITAGTGGTQSSTAPAQDQGGTKLLTKAEFLQRVWNYEKNPQQWVFLGDKPAIIDFYADWCGPCRIASPILEEISREFAGKITVYKIDTEKEQELKAVFGVRSIPAFLYIPRNGKPTMMAGIARTKEDTKKMFTDNINTLLLQGN